MRSLEKKTEETTETEAPKGKVIRREFSYTAFNRSFNLPENVSIENIKATYENGVLNITIPKVEVKKSTQTIAVA